ncbi:hypothetical protein V8F33_014155 [Rhypophila sp. PSN 637]
MNLRRGAIDTQTARDDCDDADTASFIENIKSNTSICSPSLKATLLFRCPTRVNPGLFARCDTPIKIAHNEAREMRVLLSGVIHNQKPELKRTPELRTSGKTVQKAKKKRTTREQGRHAPAVPSRLRTASVVKRSDNGSFLPPHRRPGFTASSSKAFPHNGASQRRFCTTAVVNPSGPSRTERAQPAIAAEEAISHAAAPSGKTTRPSFGCAGSAPWEGQSLLEQARRPEGGNTRRLFPTCWQWITQLPVLRG